MNQTKELKTETTTIDRKEFMKQVGMGFGAILLMNCLQACGETEIPDPNPGGGGSGKVDFSLSISMTGNTALLTKGGFLVTNGVIIARTLQDTFIAVAAACTHQGTIINYRKDNNDFLCPNHGSIFKSDGAVTNGPATASLKKYNVTFTANTNTVRVFE